LTLSVGDVVTGLATDEFPGGLIVEVDGVATAMPTDQIGPYGRTHPSAELAKHVTVKVLAVDDSGAADRPPIVSQRAIAEEERAQRAAVTWPGLVAGATVEGTIFALEPYRVRLDVGGVEASVHLSDIRGAFLTHPAQAFVVGQTLPIEVVALDPEAQTITRALAQFPTSETLAPPSHVDRQHHVLRLLRVLIGKHQQHLAPETLALLQRDPAIVGTLAGVMAFYDLPIPFVAPDPTPVETDLAFLGQRVRLLTGFGFACTLVPDQRPTILFSNVTVLDRLENGRGTLRPLGRFRDVWCGQGYTAESPARIAAAAANDEGRARAEELHELLWSTAPIPPPQPRPTDVRHLGMLTMCSDEDALAGLVGTIEEWDESLAMFGRRGLRLTVSDDSPPQWRERVRDALAELQTVSGLTIRYTSRTPRHAWINGHADPTLRAALDVVVGGTGPCPNRNWALLNLERPCLQLDDDITPEVVTASHETLQARYMAGGHGQGAAGLPKSIDVCPLDVLGAYADSAVGALGSPVCSGADDVAVDDVVAAAGKATDDTPYKFLAMCLDVPRGLEVVKGPAFFPNVPELMPLQPPIRDGDEAYVSVMEALGTEPARITTAIHQRAEAGSRAAPDQLLWVTTRSQLGWRLIRAALSQVSAPATLQTVGEALAKVAEWDTETIGQLWAPRLKRTLDVAAGFVEARRANGRDASSMASRFGLDQAALQSAMEAEVVAAIAAYGTVLARWDEVRTVTDGDAPVR